MSMYYWMANYPGKRIYYVDMCINNMILHKNSLRTWNVWLHCSQSSTPLIPMWCVLEFIYIHLPPAQNRHILHTASPTAPHPPNPRTARTQRLPHTDTVCYQPVNVCQQWQKQSGTGHPSCLVTLSSLGHCQPNIISFKPIVCHN